MAPRDPIKDLMAEIAANGEDEEPEAEEAPPAKEAKAEEAEDAPEKEEEPAAEEKPEKPRKGEKFVPIARLNETEAKRRTAERERDQYRERIAELEKASKEGKQPVDEEERKSIAATARAAARVQVMAESMVEAGYENYGQKEFDAVSSALVELGAPDNLILIALEATGSPSMAARAIFNLGQEEAEEITRICKMSPLRLAAQLARYSTTRVTRKAKEEDDEEEEQPKKPRVVSRAPAPIKPVRGSNKVNDDEIGDDLTEEQFTERFDKLMDKRQARRN